MITKNYEELIRRLKDYGQSADEVQAVLIIGSQARREVPADQYSDLDIILVVSDPSLFLYSDEWLKFLGRHNISFVENTIGGEKERRVLFDGGLDVDFVIVSQKTVEAVLLGTDGLDILRKGYEILLDKTALSNKLRKRSLPAPKNEAPSADEYQNLVNDFWYHTVWTAKKLLRGELWAAKFCVDGYMKYKLLWLLEFHAHVIHGWDYNTWHSGRFIDSWADRQAMRKMSTAFAHYEKEDIAKALVETMDIFSRIAQETAEETGYTYPAEAEKSAREWLGEHLPLAIENQAAM